MTRRFAKNVPTDLAQTLQTYMKRCGYSGGTVEMRIGNLGYLFEVIGSQKLEQLLASDKAGTSTAVDYIVSKLLPGGVHTADIQSFKLAWESLNGQELFKKRVKQSLLDDED